LGKGSKVVDSRSSGTNYPQKKYFLGNLVALGIVKEAEEEE
jgi:hypothetical protein